MFKKSKEWRSMQWAKNPERMIVLYIALFNVCFLIISAVIVKYLALTGTESLSIWQAMFYTLAMILDAGCITFVISDIGYSGLALVLACLTVVIIGMIAFTGAIIGTFTNAISHSIEKSRSGFQKLSISNHFVILNWNTRASEIVNDLLYRREKQRVVVLADGRMEEIEKEIKDRIEDTIEQENKALREQLEQNDKLGFLQKKIRYQKEKLRDNLFVIVREGDVFSAKQLNDICLERARSVIILGDDINNIVCKFQLKAQAEIRSKGNAHTIKTLMQVSDIVGSNTSDDNQRIIVEVSDDWTGELVNRIIKNKMRSQDGEKSIIIPVRVNQLLGRILAQFSLMPELNLAYRELFSNKGATFHVKEWKPDFASGKSRRDVEVAYIDEYLKTHKRAVPLCLLEQKAESYLGESAKKHFFYFVADSLEDVEQTEKFELPEIEVKLKEKYDFGKKRVIILGHNAGFGEIMKGFAEFCGEWDPEGINKTLELVVIDDQEHLDQVKAEWKDAPFEIIPQVATIFDQDIICDTINQYVPYGDDAEQRDVSILILSDDTATNESIDANALANLVYVQEIIGEKREANPQIGEKYVDTIVELINPKHHDVVSNYGIKNVVISNRYISKMVTQIGDKEVHELFTDILTYDSFEDDVYESNEIYAKKVADYFMELPPKCTQGQLIRAVWHASKKNNNPTLVLGYVTKDDKVTLFSSHQDEFVELHAEDKLIIFSNH